MERTILTKVDYWELKSISDLNVIVLTLLQSNEVPELGTNIVLSLLTPVSHDHLFLSNFMSYPQNPFALRACGVHLSSRFLCLKMKGKSKKNC